MSVANLAESISSQGASAMAAMRDGANTRVRPSSKEAKPIDQAVPRRIPRPRAMASASTSPGAATAASWMPSTGPSSAPTRAAAMAVARTALPRLPRRRRRASGNGVRTSSGSDTSGSSAATENKSTQRRADQRTDLGSGRSVALERGSCAPADAATASSPAPALLRRVGQQGDGARALDGQRQLALVLGAGAEHAPRQQLSALGDEGDQHLHVLVVDVVDLVGAEPAHLAPP